MSDFALFAGSANPHLARSVADILGVRLSGCTIERFPDGETTVRIAESVRKREVFIVQPTSPPVNDHLVELLALVDACRRAAAGRITVIVPYFGYARADKRHGRREPVTARLVADLLETAGADHLVTVDLHARQIEGFFRIPVDSLTAVPTLAGSLRRHLPERAVVVSPDAGRVPMATEYANRLNTSVVVLHKRRESGTQTAVTHVVGEVRDRPCVIIDDMISTGGTLVESVRALLQAGARPEITVAATHGLLLPGAQERLAAAGIRRVVVTDTIPPSGQEGQLLDIVSVAPLIAGAVRRFLADGSLSDLF